VTALTLGQAMRNAIEAENAAARFYALLAQSTQDADAKTFLEQMAVQERHHAKSVADVADVQLPSNVTGRVELVETAPEWAYLDDITYGQALEVALEAERHAHLFYDAVAEAAKGEVADFFRALARQELDHVEALEKRIRGSTPGS
jgi:rubrerythrin